MALPWQHRLRTVLLIYGALNAFLYAGLLPLWEGFDEPFQEAEYTDSLLRNRMLNELFHEAVPVILHEDDRNAMFFSMRGVWKLGAFFRQSLSPMRFTRSIENESVRIPVCIGL